MSLSFILCLLLLTDAPPGVAILLCDFSTSSVFYPPALALNTSVTLAKYLGCAFSTSTSLSGGVGRRRGGGGGGEREVVVVVNRVREGYQAAQCAFIADQLGLVFCHVG